MEKGCELVTVATTTLEAAAAWIRMSTTSNGSERFISVSFILMDRYSDGGIRLPVYRNHYRHGIAFHHPGGHLGVDLVQTIEPRGQPIVKHGGVGSSDGYDNRTHGLSQGELGARPSDPRFWLTPPKPTAYNTR